MTWLKTDDGTWMAPWVVAVGNEAFGIHQRLGSYAAQYLTDGGVPGHVVAMIAAGNEKALEDLERYREIDRMDSGAIVLVNFLRDNPSRAQVEADRIQRAERGRKGAQARWGSPGARRPPADA